MGKLRDKLSRVNAPRPTTLPDGTTSEVAEARAEERHPAPTDSPIVRRAPPASPPPSRPRTFALDAESGSDVVAGDASSGDDEGVEATRNIPRFRKALERASTSDTRRGEEDSRSDESMSRSAPSDGISPPTRRDAYGREGSASTVFRSRDFEKWRKKRNQPHLEARRESQPEPAAPVEPLVLERPEGAPATGEDYLHAARLEEARNRPDEAVRHLERALRGPLGDGTRWSVLRRLAELYVDRGSDKEALPLLRELCEGTHGDPYPLVVLAALVSDEEPGEAAELRRRAKEIAPWLE